MEIDDKWKVDDENYFKELLKMLDIIEKVKDEELKRKLLFQYAKCDNLITKLAIKEMNKK